jgi:hypothetical protein
VALVVSKLYLCFPVSKVALLVVTVLVFPEGGYSCPFQELQQPVLQGLKGMQRNEAERL